jgi:hypothetical protein
MISIGAGNPAPSVTWFRDGQLEDDQFEQSLVHHVHRVSNVLHYSAIRPEHARSLYTCRAVNNNFSAPIERSIRMQINGKHLLSSLCGFSHLSITPQVSIAFQKIALN